MPQPKQNASLQINLEEIEHNLSDYIQRVTEGETFIIIHGGKAVAEIRPIFSEHKHWRPFGLCAGAFTVPEGFDDPLPEDVMSEFEGR